MSLKGMLPAVARGILLVLLVLALASPLAACGKKGKLKGPEDSTWPQSYPAE